jgi:Ni,Fe-hydrogenase III small subunit
MTPACELAARRRADLLTTATYGLTPDGLHSGLLTLEPASGGLWGRTDPAAPLGDRPGAESLEALGAEFKTRVRSVLGRSLHIRQVDAASCNGCEIEIAGLNSPVYDLERFGIHFVASPRHADMLLVTGPVSRNMELALRKTYDATPEPRLVVAVGACGCGGGIFGQNYACLGGVDKVLPVDVYIPGCPPNPHALLHGILTAIGRWPKQGP